MPPSKKTMLEGRLNKRLRQLGLASYSEYCDFLFNPQTAGEEMLHLVDVVTTNKTDFFREPRAFYYLFEKILPELASNQDVGAGEKVKVWSAGCSTGEEPYTLAMLLTEFAGQRPRFDFSILATDISSRVLKQAGLAVYRLNALEPIPQEFRKKYLLRSKDKTARVFRVAPAIRDKVRFQRLNLMEDFGLKGKMHIIFCRNVIIYFDRPTQEHLLSRLCRQLRPGGYLFLGHSETLSGMNLPLVSAAPMIYRKTE